MPSGLKKPVTPNTALSLRTRVVAGAGNLARDPTKGLRKNIRIRCGLRPGPTPSRLMPSMAWPSFSPFSPERLAAESIIAARRRPFLDQSLLILHDRAIFVNHERRGG